MRKEVLYITLTLMFAFFLRILFLGQVPPSPSVDEAKFGIDVSNFLKLGPHLNLFLIRFPFALLGTIEVLLVFLALKKLGKNFLFSLVAAAVLSLLPWHISLSRIYSTSLILFGAGLFLTILFSGYLNKYPKQIGLIFSGILLIVFSISVLSIMDRFADNVDQQRRIAFFTPFGKISTLASNKLIESVRFKEKFIFENVDFGNYFFQGHPRARVGVEEIPKLYLILLPAVLIGFVKLEPKMGWVLLPWVALGIFLPAIFEFRGPEASLFYVFPIVVLTAYGVLLGGKYIISHRIVFLILATIASFEIIYTNVNYFFSFSESAASSRYPIYEKLSAGVGNFIAGGQQVTISSKLSSAPLFLEYYLGGKVLNKVTFKDISSTQIQSNEIFVDTLSDNASPVETIYKVAEGESQTRVIERLRDSKLNQTIIIYSKND